MLGERVHRVNHSLLLWCDIPFGRGTLIHLHFQGQAHLFDLPEGVLEHIDLGLMADAVHYHLCSCVCVGSSSLTNREDSGVRVRFGASCKLQDPSPNKCIHVRIIPASFLTIPLAYSLRKKQ